jgi:hypothetical protein
MRLNPLKGHRRIPKESRAAEIMIVHREGTHGMIQMDLGGHPPFPLNHHFDPVVLINHDIHPFNGE